MTRRELYNLIEPDRFTRSWWLAHLRGGMWVVLVTAFLWIWADVEFTDQMELSATVQLTTAPSSNLVLLSKSRIRVNFKVQGRQTWYIEPAEIQRDLDRFIAYYNLERSHQGYRPRGRTPAQANSYRR